MKELPYICFLVVFFEEIVAKEIWVDPHDMNINTHYKQPENIRNRERENLSVDPHSIYLKKIVGQLIKNVYLDTFSDIYSRQINIKLTSEEYNFLRNFLFDDAPNDYAWKRLIAILDTSMEDSILSTYTELLYLAFWNEHTAIALALVVTAYILWKVQPHNYKLRTLFKIFFPLVYISDFMLRYLALIEEVEVDKYLAYKKYENYDESSLGWLDWFYCKMSGGCARDEKSFRLSQRAAIHIITPMKVLGEQFDIIVPILTHLGNGAGNFIMALVEDVPWYVKPFMGLLAFILVVVIILMMGSYALGTSPRIKIFHFLNIEFLHKDYFQNRNLQRPQDTLSGENLSRFLKLSESRHEVKQSAVEECCVPSSSKSINITYKTKGRYRTNGIRKPKAMPIEKKIKCNPINTNIGNTQIDKIYSFPNERKSDATEGHISDKQEFLKNLD